MKDDVLLPAAVPKKRRAIEHLLDRHIAFWLASDMITPSERRRLQAEKDRRKALAAQERKVGVVIDAAGITPQQLEVLPDLLRGASEVHHRGLPSRVHMACKREVGRVVIERDDREVIRAVDDVVACPKESTVQTYATPGVWMSIGAARRRSLPVQVIGPGGQLLGESDE